MDDYLHKYARREDLVRMEKNYQVRLRVVSDVGQPVGHEYLEPHVVTEMKCWGWELDSILAMVRSDEEKQALEVATKKYEKKLAKYIEEGGGDPDLEERFPESPQSVFAATNDDMELRPLLSVEQELLCSGCQATAFEGDIKDGKCACGGTEWQTHRLPPPKDAKEYTETSDVVKEVIRALAPVVVETIQQINKGNPKKPGARAN